MINLLHSEGYSISFLCQMFKVSRQSYYQQQDRQHQRILSEEVVVQRVLEIRHRHPKMGGRKLYHLLGKELSMLPSPMGRDKLFSLLKEQNLLVLPQKRSCKTTQSNHNYWKYSNLIEGWQPHRRDQLWVSDITYIRLKQTFMYLALVTDAFSRMVVGFDVSESLTIDGSMRALKMSLKQATSLNTLIHHSDRGVQYCSHAYVNLLKLHLIRISMTQNGSPYENALAERINGILKGEYLLGDVFNSRKQLINTVEQAIYLYNHERPHNALSMLTPAQVHLS